LLFNSYEFIFIFLPLTFFLYFYLNSKKLTIASNILLVFSSLFFYSWWNINYLPIILSSIFFNYFLAKHLNSSSNKAYLIFGIFMNLLLLGYFKYTDFMIDNLNYWILKENLPNLNLALPLAISFFTFQQIAYLSDSFSNKTKESNFLNYALFVTFFPQLIAGPIVHHKEMMPQFRKLKNKLIDYRNIATGLFIFSIGLFKKVVIADTFAIWANHGFDVAETLSLVEAWATSLSYTFQLYFDFSGYADMAIGLALLFNIKLPINFNSPYKSTSLIEFWERWHITLSTFVSLYIFKPILKSFTHYSFNKGLISIFISMLVIGLWHGASWIFVFFGAIHGIGIVINHVWKKKIKIPIPYYLGWFLTFNLVSISMIFFRAKEWEDIVKILSSMIGTNSIGDIQTLRSFAMVDELQFFYLIVAFFLAFIGFFFKNSMSITKETMKKKRAYIYMVLLLWISILHLNRANEFLYFNF